MCRLVAWRRTPVDHVAVFLLQIQQVRGEARRLVLEDDLALCVRRSLAEVDPARQRKQVGDVGVLEVDFLAPARSQDVPNAVHLGIAAERAVQLRLERALDGVHPHPARVPALLSLFAIVGVKVAGVDRFAEGVERGEFVLYARFGERSAETRFVPCDC